MLRILPSRGRDVFIEKETIGYPKSKQPICGYFVRLFCSKKHLLEFFILNILQIRWLFPQRITTRQQRGTTYYNVATTWYNIATMWLQRSKNVTERERNACAVLLLGCGTLSYVVVRYDTLWYAILHGGSEAQHGGSEA